MPVRGGATSRGNRVNGRQRGGRKPGEWRKKTETVAAAASSPGAPSQIKMQDTEISESNGTNNNEELAMEKNDTLKSLNDSDLSFIILSKCTSESPNNSMMNTLNLSSPESNFSEKRIMSIVRENMKLKQMFRHKNSCTRKQLNAIILLDKEIRQICENYKQRFLEATDIIDQLKEDNFMLKTTSEFNLSTQDQKETIDNAPTPRELSLIGQLRDLSRQLKDSEENYSKNQLKLKDIENKFTVAVDNFNETLRKFQEELKTLKDKLVSPSPLELLDSMNEHYKNELETKYLIELTTILKQRLDEKKLIETEHESINHKEKLQELFKCFAEYCANSLNVENFQDECNNMVQTFKKVKTSFNEDVLDDLKSQNDLVLNYKKELIDDQLQNIKDERIFRNIQIEFLKVYSDYSNVKNNIECLRNEHLKQHNKDTVSEGNIHNFAEIEKCLLEERKIIDSTRIKLNEERASIEEEKQNIREERELFDAERISLLEEKESIIEENKDIVNENLYLNREVAKLKQDLSTRRDSSPLKEELESVTAQLEEAKKQLKKSHETNSELSNEISKMLDKEEEIWAYKMQIEMQRNEFHEMQQAEQNFLHQIENLSEEIRRLREENERLQQINNQQEPQIQLL